MSTPESWDTGKYRESQGDQVTGAEASAATRLWWKKIGNMQEKTMSNGKREIES